jgi:hypothetical protein
MFMNFLINWAFRRLMPASALLPVSAIGLGPPRPYAAVAAGPGGTAL